MDYYRAFYIRQIQSKIDNAKAAHNVLAGLSPILLSTANSVARVTVGKNPEVWQQSGGMVVNGDDMTEFGFCSGFEARDEVENYMALLKTAQATWEQFACNVEEHGTGCAFRHEARDVIAMLYGRKSSVSWWKRKDSTTLEGLTNSIEALIEASDQAVGGISEEQLMTMDQESRVGHFNCVKAPRELKSMILELRAVALKLNDALAWIEPCTNSVALKDW